MVRPAWLRAIPTVPRRARIWKTTPDWPAKRPSPDACLDALIRQPLLLGRYTCGEGHEAQGWLFADTAGRVGWIWFAQDDCYWRGHEHFHTHAARLLRGSTATLGLEAALAAVIGEMAGDLEAALREDG